MRTVITHQTLRLRLLGAGRVRFAVAVWGDGRSPCGAGRRVALAGRGSGGEHGAGDHRHQTRLARGRGAGVDPTLLPVQCADLQHLTTIVFSRLKDSRSEFGPIRAMATLWLDGRVLDHQLPWARMPRAGPDTPAPSPGCSWPPTRSCCPTCRRRNPPSASPPPAHGLGRAHAC
jgi:hypothetical protein